MHQTAIPDNPHRCHCPNPFRHSPPLACGRNRRGIPCSAGARPSTLSARNPHSTLADTARCAYPGPSRPRPKIQAHLVQAPSGDLAVPFLDLHTDGFAAEVAGGDES